MRIIGSGLAALMVLSGAGGDAPREQTYRVAPERARRQLEIVVQPGDRLRLTAGGCFMIPNQPPRRLLQSNPNFDQALIFIPGITMTLTPLAGLLERDLVVPRDLDTPGPASVWLDWGHSYGSPLETAERPSPEPLPCERLDEQPHLDIHITHDSDPDHVALGSLTLELPRYDRNLLPLNPSWVGKVRPDICAACDGFRLERRADKSFWVPALRSEQCTRERPYVDSGGCGPHRGECVEPGRRLAGHVNWGPATFTGLLSTVHGGPVHLALDGDINFYLEPDGGAGLVTQKPKSIYNGVIGLEFSSVETNRWFRTPWWRAFPFRDSSYRAVGAFFSVPSRHSGAVEKNPSLRRLPATVIGIFGIDTAHGAHPEVHPVLALAIQTETHPDREIWQVLARNWGTAGDCSSRVNEGFAVHRVLLMLPGAADKRYRSAEGTFLDHGLEVSDWKVYAGGGRATLAIDLPRRACTVVEGQLTLRRGAASTDDQPHLAQGEPPIGEPIRPEFGPGENQLCTKAPWFVPVP